MGDKTKNEEDMESRRQGCSSVEPKAVSRVAGKGKPKTVVLQQRTNLIRVEKQRTLGGRSSGKKR